MTSFSNDVAFAELYYTQKIIKDLLGVTPLCWYVQISRMSFLLRVSFDALILRVIYEGPDADVMNRRPPFGDVDNRIRTIAAGLNMTTIGWSDDTVSTLRLAVGDRMFLEAPSRDHYLRFVWNVLSMPGLPCTCVTTTDNPLSYNPPLIIYSLIIHPLIIHFLSTCHG